MQYRVFDRQTLRYKDGGFVRSWYIDDDYINNNNSTIDIVSAATNANVGDVVCLIMSAGSYSKGVITSVDNEALQISYKSDKELFNDNIYNPLITEFANDTGIEVAYPFGLDIIANLIEINWGKTIDSAKRIPITITTSGSATMYWTWQDLQINFTDWLISLFKDYSVILSFDIDFNTSNDDILNRRAKYIVNISAVNNDNDIIKDNVPTQTIKYTKEAIPEKTCCVVVDSETKEILTVQAGKNLFQPNSMFGYADSILLNRNGYVYDLDYAEEPQNSNVSSYILVSGGNEYVLSWKTGDDIERYIMFYDRKGELITFDYNGQTTKYLPYSGASGYISFNVPLSANKLRFSYAQSATEIMLEAGTTPSEEYEAYNYKAIYYLCVNTNGEYYITPNIEDGNRILPVKTVYVEYDSNSSGENKPVEQVAENELKLSSLNHAIEIEIPRDTKMFDFELAKYGDRYKIITKNGTITSIYSGRRESSNTNLVTLLFGIGRLNFTDLIKETLRSRKYSKVYSNLDEQE